ncbi:hypothetical protein J2129_001640 [Methanofollis sp. W23]|nr:hypothetical protein [Methanofollis sp. W23]
MQCHFPEPPGQYTLTCTLYDLAGAVKKTFNDEGVPSCPYGRRALTFGTRVRATPDPCTVEYLITPRRKYALHDLATDRQALVATNQIFASRAGVPVRPMPLACVGYDDAGTPVGRLSFGPLSVRYQMRDRVRSGIDDLFFDKFCFHETVFETVSRFRDGRLSAYAAAWVERVEAVIEDELAAGGCDRRTIERQARAVDDFLRGVSRRYQMPRGW